MIDSARPRILITGARGFIGKNLLRRLQQRDFIVVGASRELRQESSEPDLCASVQLSADDELSTLVCALQGIEVVIHAAAHVHIRNPSAEDNRLFRAINIEYSQKLAKAARLAGVRRFIFLSSIGVMGDRSESDRMLTREDSPRPVGAYATSKWQAEQAISDELAEGNTESIILRLPLVYGPHAPGNFARLVAVVRAGLPLPFGSCTNRRSLLGIENLTDFVAKLVSAPSDLRGVWLVADDEALTVADLFREIARGLGADSRLLALPPALLLASAALLGRRDDVQRLINPLLIDTSASCSRLRWRAPCSVSEGIAAAVGDFRH